MSQVHDLGDLDMPNARVTTGVSGLVLVNAILLVTQLVSSLPILAPA